MNTTENPIEQSLVKEVWNYLGIKGSKLVIQGETGFPDRIFWLPNGRPFLAEIKRPGENPRPKQFENHAYLRKLGYTVGVYDNVPDAFEAIIKTLEASQLPKESREVLARARRRCAVLRSRLGKN